VKLGRYTRRSLGRRFTWIAALVALVVATLTVGVSDRVAYRMAEQDARHTLAGLVEAVRNTAAVGAYAGDQVLLGEVANGLVSHPMVGAVRIEVAQGTAVERRRESRFDPTAGTQVSYPLDSPFDRTERVGQIRVAVDTDALSALARKQALMLTVPMLAQVLLLAVVLGVVAARLLSRPMAGLARDLAQLQPGSAGLLPMPPAHRDDEIGLLVRHTNDLLQANATALGRERQLRAEVSAIEGQLRRLLDASSAGIFLLDAQGRLVQGNPTLVRLCTGQAAGTLSAEGFADEQFAQPGQLRQLMARALAQRHSVSADLLLRHAPAEGGAAERWVHVLLSPLPAAGGEELLEGVMYDVTQRRAEELRARHQAEHDPLTGLRNRAGLLAELDRHIPVALAGGPALSLLYLDLDGFKAVNDRHGHDAGDAVLREVASRLLSLLRRGGDTVARLGGDEFVVLLPAMGQEPWLTRFAWRVVDALSEPIALPGVAEPARIGASVGVASLPRDAADRDGLLRQADQAMYQVKRAGKHGVGNADGPLPRPAD
jgi:diguanylate cyclase (GGDEF)-like protein/PAS domain S-box-containing protein